MGCLARLVMAAAIAGAAVLPMGPGASAQDAKPLLIEGKQSLYQRVLTRPGAVMVPDPGIGTEGAAVTAFSVFYVYDRKFFGGADWVQVGARADGVTEGWVAADRTIDWKQAITVAFTDAAGRERALLYRDRDTLFDLMESETVYTDSKAYREIALSGEVPDEFPVLSIEPSSTVDITEQFYLLPILEAEEVYFSSGFTARLLAIASVTEGETGAEDDLSAAGVTDDLPERAGQLESLSAGVVFVVDTTTSMGPYIHQTREAVRRITAALDAANLDDRLGFGLVGFRDNMESTPDLDYVFRVFADLGSDHAAFLEQVDVVTAAEVSSKGFIEDSYSGVVSAIEQMNWADFDARFVVLITDAGTRNSNDPLGATGLGAAQIRELAALNGIDLYTLHLLTEEGTPNHKAAQRQYEELTATDGGSRYFAIETGDVDRFAATLDAVSAGMSTLLASSAQGQFVDPVAAAETASAGDDQLASVTEAVLKSGLAMQLEYFGSEQGSAAPSVFKAWIADRALEDPDTAVLSVHLLMTKNQLSDLQDALLLILEAGQLGQIAPQDFFSQLQSAAAAMSRNPDQINSEEARTLGELGLLGEYLEDLPYRSKVMNIDQDLWLAWSVGEQQAFLDEIQAKIRLYDKIHDDTDHWVTLDSGASPGEQVYPVPLDALP